MARTTETILAAMVASKESTSELNVLSSTSSKSLWRLIYSTVASAISLHEQLWDNYVSELDYMKLTTKPQTSAWWRDKLLNHYQYNEVSALGELVVNADYTIDYLINDNPSKIIDYVSFTQTGRKVTAKVATSDNAGVPLALDVDQLASVNDYINSYAHLGSLMVAVSYEPDKVNFSLSIEYTAGTNVVTLQSAITTTIEDYLRNLPYGGQIDLQNLTFLIRTNHEAVLRVDYLVATCTTAVANVTTDMLLVANQRHETEAGYAILDPSPVFTFVAK